MGKQKWAVSLSEQNRQLRKHIAELKLQLKAVRDEIQDCRDSWAPDQPPSDLSQFLIDLESVLETEHNLVKPRSNRT
jgi:hypothetical protein